MSNQEINSKNICIGDVFKSFYVVPDYQREYVWESEHVEQLLNDIDTDNASEYFIGSIVVCRRETETFELIDGQQRMTTLFLIICAIRNHIKSLTQEHSDDIKRILEYINQQIKNVKYSDGKTQNSYRVKLQYRDSSNILEKVAEGDFLKNGDESTLSVKNIGVAYNTILNFLKSFEDFEAINKFYGHLITKVKLIRIETPDVTQALNIFETINDRGVSLNSMDLLKNLLFTLTNPNDFDKLKKSWQELQTILFDKEKPLRFLRYFILSHYDGVDGLNENKIYDWFTGNKDKTRHDKDPIEFVDELIEVANAYCHFLNGLGATGNQSRYMQNMKLLGGRAARQHLILLLAGRHLSKDLFDRLASEVENLLFTYIIVREPAKTYEKKFIRWAGELRKIEDEPELEEFITEHFSKDKTELSLSSRFDLAFQDLRYHSVPKYRLHYILAKLTQHFDLQVDSEDKRFISLENYIGKSFEIEHIFPKTPSPAAKNEFGDHKDSEIVDRLGNLVLLEKSLNKVVGNKPYSEKREGYNQSDFLWTKILGGKDKALVGNNTAVNRAIKECEDYPEWNEYAVKKRQSEIGRLARVIWGLDDRHHPE